MSTGALFFVLALCAGVVLTQTPSVELTPVASSNFDAITELCVPPEQERFVEPPAKGLARLYTVARYYPKALAIRDVDTGNVVGLLSYELDHRKYNAWIHQFLIDCAYQGQGYEHVVLEAIQERIKSQFRIVGFEDTVYAFVHVEDVKMRELYEKHGFHFDGNVYCGADCPTQRIRLKSDPLVYSLW